MVKQAAKDITFGIIFSPLFLIYFMARSIERKQLSRRVRVLTDRFISRKMRRFIGK